MAAALTVVFIRICETLNNDSSIDQVFRSPTRPCETWVCPTRWCDEFVIPVRTPFDLTYPTVTPACHVHVAVTAVLLLGSRERVHA